MSCRPPGRDDAYPVVALGIDNEEKRSLRDAEQYPPFLPLILAIIEHCDCKRIGKRELRTFEGDAMPARVGARLCIVPFEL
jgi:hypothetical protein